MIIVTQPERLEEFGFKKNGAINSGRPIYVRKISWGTDSECYLCVNPYMPKEQVENEMVMVVQVDIAACDVKDAVAQNDGIDMEWDLPLDTLFEMMEAGIIRRVPDKKKAVA